MFEGRSADSNGDAVVTLPEIFEYLQKRLPERTNAFQHPSTTGKLRDRATPLSRLDRAGITQISRVPVLALLAQLGLARPGTFAQRPDALIQEFDRALESRRLLGSGSAYELLSKLKGQPAGRGMERTKSRPRNRV